MINISIDFGWKYKLILIIAGTLLFLFYKKMQVKEEYTHLENISKDWILIKDDECPYCQEQLEILGPKKNLFTILDTRKDKKLIKKLKLPNEGVPLWVNTKTKKYNVGLKTLDEIEKLD